jgi:Zn-dependent protease with chaperone function
MRPSDPIPAGVIALALLALPWLLAAWLRHRSLADDTRNPTGAWFRSMQWLQWLGLAGVLGNACALLRSPLREWLDAALMPGLGAWSLVALALIWLALQAWVLVPLSLAQHDVTARLKGSDDTRLELLARNLAQLAPISVLVLAIASGVACLISARVLAGLAVTLGGLVLVLPAGRFAARVRGVELHALTQGELRDRIVELAARAGVTVRGVYVLPLKRSRLANAFAVRSDAVLLTDWLIENVERKELDAIVAHELGHLKHQHPRALALAALVGAFAGAAAAWSLPFGWGYPVAVLCSLATIRFASRRFEGVADAEAAKLCGDPEALIRALVRISRLNHIPLRWSRAAERTLTHPSTERRARAIGVAAGFTPERIEALLAESPPVTDRYPLPAAIEAGGKLFSTTWKTGTAGALGWSMLAAACVAPAFALALARLLQLPRAAATLGAAFAAFGGLVAFADAFAARGIHALRPKLARKFAPAAEACFVGIAPGPELRVYEGFLDWDLGFLSIEPNALVFTGEEASLRLPRATIESIACVPGPPGWTPAPRVAIAWCDAARGRRGVLHVRPADVTTVSSLRVASPALAGELSRWLAAAAPWPDPAITPPPRLEDVSGLPLSYLVRPVSLILPCFLALPLSALACAGLLLPLSPNLGAGWLEAWASATLAFVLLRVPAWTSRRARAGAEAVPSRRVA